MDACLRAYLSDVTFQTKGTHIAPTFEDVLWLHRFFDAMKDSSVRSANVLVK